MSDRVPWVTEYHRVPNRLKVLQLIRAEGPVSRAEIARRLDLSRPTASRIIDVLIHEGIIACVGKSQPTGGLLGDLYTFRLDAGVVLGLQLGTRHARAAVATLNGQILHRTARPLALEKRQTLSPQLDTFIKDALAYDRRKSATVLAVGLPGRASSTFRRARSPTRPARSPASPTDRCCRSSSSTWEYPWLWTTTSTWPRSANASRAAPRVIAASLTSSSSPVSEPG